MDGCGISSAVHSPDQVPCSMQHRDNSGGLVATSESQQCCPRVLVGVAVSSSGLDTVYH